MKSFLSFLSCLLLAAAAFGQKNIDLGIQMISPATNSVHYNLNNGETFHQTVVVTNYGPDTVKAGQDSMYVLIDASLPINSSYLFYFPILDSTLLPGEKDTFDISFNEGQNLGGGTIIHYPVNDTVSTWALVYGKDMYGYTFNDPGYTGNGSFLDTDPMNFPGNNRIENTGIIFMAPPPQSIDVTVNNGLPPVINTYNSTLQINSAILPAGADQDVTWSISPGSIASLNSFTSSTVIIPSDNGVVWVKATSVQNPALADSIMVTISGQRPDSLVVRTQNNVPAVIDSISHTLQLQAQVYPSGLPQDVVWEIIPVDGAATISNTGLVTATAFGKVWAKAQSQQLVNYSDSLLINITTDPLSVNDIDLLQMIDIYPNPAKDAITIALGKDHPELAVSVFNVDGKILRNYNLKPNSGNLFQLSLKDYQAGIYFIQFKGEKVNLTKKIIKQ